MITSDAGLDFIMRMEGCKLEAYPDPGTGGEPWTIGVGHTGGVQPGDTCTEDQAREWLKQDAGKAEDCVNGLVNVDMKQNEFDAMVSLCFNIGCRNFRQSTLLKLINGGEYAKAAEEFLRWNFANHQVMAGLTRRREAEREMFLA
jgi:lysozyme